MKRIKIKKFNSKNQKSSLMFSFFHEVTLSISLFVYRDELIKISVLILIISLDVTA